MKERVALVSELLSLAACAVILYRVSYPDGPEPIELAREGYRRAWAWLQERTALERDADEIRQAIRDLPETEGAAE